MKRRTTTSTTRKAPGRRRTPAKRATTRRRSPSRKKPAEASFMPLLYGIGGGLLAKFAAQNDSVVKMIPDAKMRMLAITGAGVAVTMYAPKEFQAVGVGIAIGGGVTAIDLFLQDKAAPAARLTTMKGIGRITSGEVARLKEAIQQQRARINGSRPVLNGGRRPVLAGGWDGN